MCNCIVPTKLYFSCVLKFCVLSGALISMTSFPMERDIVENMPVSMSSEESGIAIHDRLWNDLQAIDEKICCSSGESKIIVPGSARSDNIRNGEKHFFGEDEEGKINYCEAYTFLN